MNKKRITGYILFFAGIIPASIFASPAKPLWILFTISIAAALSGALLIRFSGKRSRPEVTDDFSGALSDKSLMENARSIKEQILNIIQEKNSGVNSFEKVKDDIERVHAGMNYFINSRAWFQENHGIKDASIIYSDYAGAERCLMRAWSALVDGYMDEAEADLKEAWERLDHTLGLYNKIMAGEIL